MNVFNGDEGSVVEMRVGDGPWHAMKQTVAVDPTYRDVVDREEAVLNVTPAWRKLPKPKPSTHLWSAPLPKDVGPGTHVIQIRASKIQGKSHTARRTIRVMDLSEAANTPHAPPLEPVQGR